MRKTLIQCQNPNCGTRHVALLQNEPPPAAPRCIECDTPLPPTVAGEFVYFAVSPSTSKSRAIESRTMQAAPDLTAAMPRAIAPLTCARPAKMAPLLIVKSLQQSFKSRWQRHPQARKHIPQPCPTDLRPFSVMMSRIAFLLHLPSIARVHI